LGFRPLYQRIVGVGIVLACVPSLLNLPAMVTLVCAVVGLLCIVGGAFGGVRALRTLR
jgi:hypothetical protein